MADNSPKIPELLKTALKNGKVIPFVGSGISHAVRRNDGSGKPLFPSWWSYIEILEDALDNKGKSKAADYVRECLNSKPPDYLEAIQIAYNRLGETQCEFGKAAWPTSAVTFGPPEFCGSLNWPT